MQLFRITLYLINVILILYHITQGLSTDVQPYSYFVLLITDLYILWCSRKNMMLFLVAFVISYSNYSIVFANFIGQFSDTMYTNIISDDITTTSLNVLSLFNCLLLFLIPWHKVESTSTENMFLDDDHYCKPVLLLLAICMVAVFFIGYNLPESEGLRGHPTPVYEYALSFFLVYFYFSGNNKSALAVGLFFVTIYALQNFIYGGRIYGLQFILGAYIMVFMNHFSMKKTILAIVFFFIFFSIIGTARGALLSGNFDVQAILYAIAANGFALDTAYSAYYTSQTFVYVMEMLTDSTRLEYFSDFFLSIFFGESANSSAKLISVSRQFIHHNGGGVLPFFFYFYFGTIGIFIQALVLKIYLHLITKVNRDMNGLFKVVAAFIVAHSFRWYLYSPLGLFRGVLFLVIVYLGCSWIYNRILANKNRMM